MGGDPTEGPEADDEQERRKSRVEGLLKRAIEKGIEAGVGTISKGFEAGAGTVSAVTDRVTDVTDKVTDRAQNVIEDVKEVKLPREIVGYVFSQIDETKNVLVRVVAKEVHDFLEATDIATELQRALTSLSFEIKTEIRFIPNDKGGIKPHVKSRAVPKRKRRGDHEEE